MNIIIEDFIEKIKNVFSLVKNKVIDLYNQNRQLFFVFSSLLIIILLCIILLIFIPKNKKENITYNTDTLELSEKLLIPDGPELPNNYTFSRETTEKWSQQEAESWFTNPSQKDIDALSNSNNKMINEIIGAAP